eukprot:scaffold171895_cov40-Prasinocladus_malaysianus.AAC.1
MLIVTDRESANQTQLAMVMPNGFVRRTTDHLLALSNVTDMYYATQPHKLFALTAEDNELVQLEPGGSVEASLSLAERVSMPLGMTFSPDGSTLAVLDAGSRVHLFSPAGCRAGPTGSSGAHRSLLLTAGRSLKATAQTKVIKSADEAAEQLSKAYAVDSDLVDYSFPTEDEQRPLVTGQLTTHERKGKQVQVAKQLDLQNSVYLYYARLP